MDEQPRLTLSVAEAAAFLGISRNLCYELVRRRRYRPFALAADLSCQRRP